LIIAWQSAASDQWPVIGRFFWPLTTSHYCLLCSGLFASAANVQIDMFKSIGQNCPIEKFFYFFFPEERGLCEVVC